LSFVTEDAWRVQQDIVARKLTAAPRNQSGQETLTGALREKALIRGPRDHRGDKR
jgi:hypothetical protein